MPRDQEDTGTDLRERAATMRRLIADLQASAAAFVPAERGREQLGYWLGQLDAAGRKDETRLADAMGVALETIVFTASASGSTAIDRLARRHKPADPDEAAALAALLRARFGLFRVDRSEGAGVWRVTDIAGGDSLRLFDEHFPSGIDGTVLAARLSPVAGGHVTTGPVFPLDEAGLAAAAPFIRPGGRGLTNPQRCAEAVYRHVLRDGGPEVRGINRPPEAPLEPAADGLLDVIAQGWAALPPDAEADRDDELTARELTSVDSVLSMLAAAIANRGAGRDRMADAYAAIAGVQIETIARREAAGIRAGGLSLGGLARAIDEAIGFGLPGGARRLFDLLVAKLQIAPAAGGRGDTELDRLVQRIRALRARTVAQGCTEAEAMAAAAKVAELLDRHGLTLSELELRSQVCEGVGIETGRRRVGPIDECVPAISQFFDCRAWVETAADRTLRHVFFGMPGDVSAAHYLYDLVERAFETETAVFRAGPVYQALAGGDRRSAVSSFQHGLGQGIRGKLHDLRQARERRFRQTSGRDLVPVKASAVDDEVARLGLQLRQRGRTKQRMLLADAFAAGKAAGAAFDYRPGLASGAA